MLEDALEVATDPNYRFDLAIQLGKLEIAKAIAFEVQSESKWKQLGELAMSTGKKLDEIEKHLLGLNSGDETTIRTVIEEFSLVVQPDKDSILHKLTIINKCFGEESVEKIVKSLV